MEKQERQLILNWCPAHDDLKRSIEESGQENNYEPGNGQGWTYLTFFPKGTNPRDVLFDIDELKSVAQANHYHLPMEVVAQHNKIVLTAYSDKEPPTSPLAAIFAQVALFAQRFYDSSLYPAHGIYGKFGGIYERPEKGRVLAIYSRSDEALLAIYESIERLIAEMRLEGFRYELAFSNGLSAIPRMLDGFDDPEFRHAGNRYFRITDPNRFSLLLDQARKDYEMYRFDKDADRPRTVH